MSIRLSSVIAAPRAQVFAWHERAGALERLMPPWQLVRVRAEASSLRDGRATLAVPPGLRVIAEHGDYDPPHQFVDRMVSPRVPWRHRHRFEVETEHSTRMIDEIDTPVPAALLRPMLAYRHRQLADDLAAHAWAATLAPGPRTVAVTGSSGLIGSALCALLTTGGHRVIRLVRRAPRSADERRWDPADPHPGLLDGVDAVVHLAGAPVAGRFTAAHKRAVRDSRIGPTRRLAELIAARADPPTLISASGINYYGADRGEQVLTEDTEPGEGFLAEVVTDWEAATTPAADAGARVVQVRTGIVQSPRGGVLQMLYPLFLAGLGGRLAGGRQWTAWIGIDDLLDVYYRALVDESLAGPVNAVAPNPVRNAEYTAVLARVLRRPALLPVPAFGPRLLLGAEGSAELAEANLRVHPARLLAAGHRFRRPELEPTLRHLTGHAGPS